MIHIHLKGTLYDRTGLDGLSLVFDDIIAMFARTAVPIFLAISGYCLYRNNQTAERASIKRSLRHITLLTMEAIAMYVIIGIILNGVLATAARFTSNIFFNSYCLISPTEY